MAETPRQRYVFVVERATGGGAEHVVSLISGVLAQDRSARVEIVALLDPPGERTTDEGVVVRGLGAARVRRAVPALVRDLRADPPSVVVSTLKHVSLSLGLARRLIRPVRHVARIANTYSRELAAMPPPRRVLYRALLRHSHRRIDGFITVSRGVAEDLSSTLGIDPARCHTIPNPVDVDVVTRLADDPAPCGLEAARVRFLSVGRLVPQKHHELALRSFALVADPLDAQLVVVGDGPLRCDLERLAHELGIDERVVFTGRLENPYPLFRASTALVLSSRFEGMPNVLLEAHALGLWPISTDCPHGPAEIITDEHLGELVPPDDVTRLADAMQRAAAAPHDAALLVEHARTHHDLAGTAAAYRRVLDDADGMVGATSKPVLLAANLGIGRPPNGQTVKAREVLALLRGTGRCVQVADVGTGARQLMRLPGATLRDRTIVVTLNRKGLWVALGLIAATAAVRRRRPAVLVVVVGGWLPSQLGRHRWCRMLARSVDEFLAETDDLVQDLRAHHVAAQQLINFRDLSVDAERVGTHAHEPLRLLFAGRIRADKGVLDASLLVGSLHDLGIDATLDIFGPVEEASALAAAVDHHGVSYRGVYESPVDAQDLMFAYDFLVLPTRYVGECMPGSVVEAAFAGLPAVVSDWKALGELVEHRSTGLVIPLEGFAPVAAKEITGVLADDRSYERMVESTVATAARYSSANAVEFIAERLATYGSDRPSR